MQITQKNFYKKFLGRAGEQKALEYLLKAGYKLLEKNYKTHLGEIDLIVKDESVIVFVEVKTRLSDDFGAPAEAVTKRKQEKYFLVATQYLKQKHAMDAPSRFDVIEIENGQINHIIDAFCM